MTHRASPTLLLAVSAGMLMVSEAGRAAEPGSPVAVVRRLTNLSGTIEGSLQVLAGESISLAGSSRISGDLFVPGSPLVRLNGKPTYGGTVDAGGAPTPTDYHVALSGNTTLRHVVRRTDPIALPDVASPPTPSGIRNLSINSAYTSVGDFVTLRNLALGGAAGQVTVPPGTYGDFTATGGAAFVLGVAGQPDPTVYDFQRLTLNDHAALEVVGPVIVTVNEGLRLSGRAGDATHPEWLVLNVARGDVSLNGSAEFFGLVQAPSGTVTLAGNSSLTGSVSADRLNLQGGTALHLLAVKASNSPPIVRLTAPAAGTVLPLAGTLVLRAVAEDSDGRIAKVEFFQGVAKLGEVSAEPFEFRWENVLPGDYSLAAKATDNQGGNAISDAVSVTVLAVLPYFTGFEPVDGYRVGLLGGQGGWTTRGSVSVVEAAATEGSQAVMLEANAPPAQAIHDFPAEENAAVVFVDVFARPVADLNEPASPWLETDFAAIGFASRVDAGELLVWYGDGSGGIWQPTGFTSPLTSDGEVASWLRLTLRGDFTTQTWDVFADGRLIAYDLPFRDPSHASLTRVTLSGGNRAAAFYDDIFLGFENPLFGDADHDALDDAWEQANGLDPTRDDRDGDRDADGLTNLTELILGTRPDRADTDGDGTPDGVELAAGRSPLKGVLPDTQGIVNLRVYLPAP